MTADATHPKDEIPDLLGHRLDEPARARVEAHIKICEECGRETDALRRVKEAMRTGLKGVEMPADLAARVSAALDREARGAALKVRSWRLFLGYAAAAAAVVFLVLYFLQPRDLPTEVARDYERYRSGAILLELRTRDTRTMEKFFAEDGIAFRTRVFDLGMMQYELLGGRVQPLRNRPSAFFVYRSPDNKVVVCQMFEGTTRELPKGAELREHNGFNFYIYRRKAATLVFWQEGNVVCVLSSDIAPEEVIALAFAKAMRV